MKALVTGGSGFIGKEIVKELISKGFEVNVLDLWDINIEGTTHFKGSVLNMEDIQKAIEGCEYVVHLAAVLGVSKAARRPVECLDVNIIGTRNILEACVKNNIKKVLFSSSSEVYGEPEKVPIEETDSLQPKSEYGVSKVVGEEYMKAFNTQHKLDYSIVRFFNVYGEEQEHSFVMSRFVNYAVLGKEVPVYGEGNQIRAFCHVKDAARGAVAVLLSDKTSKDVFNIGNRNGEISMKELAEKALSIAGREDKPVFVSMKDSDRKEEREIYKRVPDTTKAKNTIGFEAEISVEEGIKRMVEFKKQRLEQIKKDVEVAEEFQRVLKNEVK